MCSAETLANNTSVEFYTIKNNFHVTQKLHPGYLYQGSKNFCLKIKSTNLYVNVHSKILVIAQTGNNLHVRK